MENIKPAKLDLAYKDLGLNTIQCGDIIITFIYEINKVKPLESDNWYILPLGIKSIHKMKDGVKHGQEIIFEPFAYRVLENSIWKKGEKIKVLYKLTETVKPIQEKCYLIFYKRTIPTFGKFEILIDLKETRGEEIRIENGNLMEILDYAPGGGIRHIYTI